MPRATFFDDVLKLILWLWWSVKIDVLFLEMFYNDRCSCQKVTFINFENVVIKYVKNHHLVPQLWKYMTLSTTGIYQYQISPSEVY